MNVIEATCDMTCESVVVVVVAAVAVVVSC